MNSGSFVNALLALDIGSLHLEEPLLLLIVAIPLIVLFTVAFALVTRKENANGHSTASYVLHIVLAIIIGFAAAGTSWITTLTETNVYVVADVSYSANKNLDEIDNIIKNRIILPRNSKLGVVTFGKDYELLCDLGDQQNAVSVKESTVDDSETNIAEALSYAGSLFNDNVIKKIVLITDGKQTDETDAYAVRRAIDTLESLGVEVNAIYIDNNFDPGTPEVQISDAEFTKSAFINHEEWVDVIVQASVATRAIMTLSSGETQLQERLVDLQEGTNSVRFNLDTGKSGTFDYVVEVIAENDTSEYNNTYSFTQSVSSDIKLLIIAGSWKSCTALVEKYADYATIDAYENYTGMDVSVSTKRGFWDRYADNDKIHGYNCNPNVATNYSDVPCTIEQLSKYDEIILADVDISTLVNSTEIIRNLDTVVSLLGKSLVTLGNVYIQDSAAETYTESAKGVLKSLDNMLPIRFGQSEDDPKLYALVLDISRSMSDNNPSRLAMEKAIAANLLSTLNDTDEICIVTFYGNVSVLQPPTSLGKRETIIDAINNLNGIQGTVIGSGLQAAYDRIRGLEGYVGKQVMLISDFIDSTGYENDPITVAAQMFDEDEIVTSCVNVNRSDSAAVSLADRIAAAGGGKAYHYNSISDSTNKVEFDAIVGKDKVKMPEGSFSVYPTRPNDDALTNIDATLLPTVSKFVSGVNKASAVSVLQLNYPKKGNADSTAEDSDESISYKQVPLYSYWKYGNGKVTSFTSSIGEGIGNWQSSGVSQILMDNILEVNTPGQKAEHPYVLEVLQEDSFTRVQVILADLHFGTTASIKLTLPDGEVIQTAMTFESYLFYYEFKSAEKGKYQIDIDYIYNNRSYPSSTAINVSYTSEYDAFTTFEPSMLFKAVDGRGTVITEGDLTVTNVETNVGTYTMDYTYALLIISVVLYVVDIVVRKLKWEDIVSFFGGFKKTQKTNSGGNAK